jgi:hypothetical protein
MRDIKRSRRTEEEVQDERHKKVKKKDRRGAR